MLARLCSWTNACSLIARNARTCAMRGLKCVIRMVSRLGCTRSISHRPICGYLGGRRCARQIRRCPVEDFAPLLERAFSLHLCEQSYLVNEINGEIPDFIRGTY